jgi:polyphosphate kinase
MVCSYSLIEVPAPVCTTGIKSSHNVLDRKTLGREVDQEMTKDVHVRARRVATRNLLRRNESVLELKRNPQTKNRSRILRLRMSRNHQLRWKVKPNGRYCQVDERRAVRAYDDSPARHAEDIQNQQHY